MSVGWELGRDPPEGATVNDPPPVPTVGFGREDKEREEKEEERKQEAEEEKDEVWVCWYWCVVG